MSYQVVSDVLQQCACGVDAAEAHGVACGLLCGEADVDLVRWWQLLDAKNFPEQEGEYLLQDLLNQTADDLASPQCNFALFLPDDERDIDERAEALGQWCQGFLYGLGVTAPDEDAELQAEILRDISNISQINHLNSDDDESERAYMELVEYLRVAVLQIYAIQRQ